MVVNAGKKNEDKNPKDEKITRSEEYVTEDEYEGYECQVWTQETHKSRRWY